MEQTQIAHAIEAHAPRLMELKHVVGVGESNCNGEPCIRVYLEQVDPQTLNEIPTELDGIIVIKEVSGPLSAAGNAARHSA